MSYPGGVCSVPLKVQLLGVSGKLPSRFSPNSAGLDIYPAEHSVIDAQHRSAVSTQIAMEVPVGESFSRMFS